MTRTPPTIEDLKSIGRSLLEQSRMDIERDGQTMPRIILGDAVDGSDTQYIMIDPAIMNPNGDSKDKLAAMVREKIAKHGFMHAVFLSDSWVIKLDTDDDKRAWALADRLLRGYSYEQIHKATDIGELREQVFVTVQTVIGSIGMALQYWRDADGVLSFGEIADMGEMTKGRFLFF